MSADGSPPESETGNAEGDETDVTFRALTDGFPGEEALAAARGRPCLEHLWAEDALFDCVWDVILQASAGDDVSVFI